MPFLVCRLLMRTKFRTLLTTSVALLVWLICARHNLERVCYTPRKAELRNSGLSSGPRKQRTPKTPKPSQILRITFEEINCPHCDSIVKPQRKKSKKE